MKEKQDRLKYLLNQYANQTASQWEENELFKIIGEAKHDNLIKKIMLYMIQTEDSTTELDKDQWETVLKTVLGQEDNDIRGSPSVYKIQTEFERYTFQRTLYLKRWAITASILILFSSGWYFISSTRNNLPAPIAKIQKREDKLETDIPPGRDQAVLTLADGFIINLDSVKNGTLTRQGNIKVMKGGTGELLYYADQQNSKESGYNTISIPRGGRHEIVLSDGSKVWLNAASSLTFPTLFKGNIRNVSLTGEGYFEVARNLTMPFHVTINDITVEVLGTHFNVNAYSDEHSVATTLVEGSVKVKSGASGNGESQTVLLKPGEQVDLAKDGRLKVNHHADIEQAVAWKDNNFEFNNAAIPTIMRQISRWYDVEVDYKGSIPERRLTGKFSRNVNLSQLVEMLRYTGMNMKIENKKIIIWETQTSN